jgi:hypothetical protein
MCHRRFADRIWTQCPTASVARWWETEVYDWLSDNTPQALDDTDDHGGWPDETELRAAFDALGYTSAAAV